MYDAIEDPYCYPGTTVLINKLDLREQSDLDAFEAEITAQRATEQLPIGELDDRHYRAIHRHLFQDVYAWAGTFRTVRIAKNGSMFCYPEHIDREMHHLFDAFRDADHFRKLRPAKFAQKAAHFLSDLNAIHPFREDNGRTQLVLLTLMSDRAAHPLDLDQMRPSKMLEAMVQSFGGDETELRREIEGLLH